VRRRIREAIVGVAALILLALGIPLAVVVHRSVLDREVVELQATAATALAEIELPLRTAQVEAVAMEPDAPQRFAVYGTDGTKLAGRGPATADEPVDRAQAGQTASSVDGEIVVATPIVEKGSERVVGVLRLSESLADADQRSRTAWLVMGGAAMLALGLAWVVGSRLARILAEPLSDLAASASSVGDGVRFEPGPPSGLAEIDAVAAALAERSSEVHAALQRERQFSADVSHQLRTPVTALRLKLEGSGRRGLDEDAVGDALRDVDRLDATIGHLLAVARDSIPVAGEVALDEVVGEAATRWRARAASEDRSIVVGSTGPARARAHRASLDEIIDVLVDNGLRHGTGTISLGVRRTSGGVALDVADEGEAITLLDAERIFDRGQGSHGGAGIGLDVARSLAEADGGRLVLTRHHPTTFSLILLEEPVDPMAP